MKLLSDPQIISGYLIESPFESLPEVTHCGEALCVRGHHLPPHSHPVFEFVVLVQGTATWRIAAREYTQECGDIFVAFPNQRHGSGREPNPENRHLWIGIDLNALDGEGKRLAKTLRRGGRHLYSGDAGIEPLVRGFLAQATHPRKGAVGVARHYLATLVALLLQSADKVDTATGESAVPRSVPVQRSVAYMEKHLGQRLPLQSLAHIAGMRNVGDFCDRFRREVGVTPAAMHLRMRLDAGREALAGQNRSVTEVAMQFGFSSSQHFSMAFKREFGMTPKLLRTKSRTMDQPQGSR